MSAAEFALSVCSQVFVIVRKVYRRAIAREASSDTPTFLASLFHRICIYGFLVSPQYNLDGADERCGLALHSTSTRMLRQRTLSVTPPSSGCSAGCERLGLMRRKRLEGYDGVRE